jgi:methylmalonyl-CoA mutase N-terminal domain/subunit
VNPEVGERQRARLAKIRAERDNAKVAELLGTLERAATGTDNLMPILIDCVENYITLGEICHVLRGVWGEYEGALAI